MLIGVTFFLLISGLLIFLLAFFGQRKVLQAFFVEPGALPKGLLYQPFQELLLGLVFTFAALFFARRLVGGSQALNLAVCVAAFVAMMSSSGSMARFQAGLKKLALPEEQSSSLLAWQRFCCLGILFLLLGSLAVLCRKLGMF